MMFIIGFISGVLCTFLFIYYIGNYANRDLKLWFAHHRQLKAEVLKFESKKKSGFVKGMMFKIKTLYNIIVQERKRKKRYKEKLKRVAINESKKTVK